ncbi:MAG: hypothetical protein C0485_16360 [Pirellula sp.]|nr:hypothetical protein [Pirellula sp.]
MNAIAADPVRKATRNRVDQPRLAPTGAARELLANHPHFRGRADRFRLELCDGALVVEGVVPSFYLKQLLQQVLRNVRGVRQIQNRVAVVNAYGLSSHDSRLAAQSETTGTCQPSAGNTD